jgi:hypothetical protein
MVDRERRSTGRISTLSAARELFPQNDCYSECGSSLGLNLCLVAGNRLSELRTNCDE